MRLIKGVYLLSDLCLAGNVDGLLDDITGLIGIYLLPEPEDSTDNVSNQSSEDEYSEKNIIFCGIKKRLSSPISSL